MLTPLGMAQERPQYVFCCRTGDKTGRGGLREMEKEVRSAVSFPGWSGVASRECLMPLGTRIKQWVGGRMFVRETLCDLLKKGMGRKVK